MDKSNAKLTRMQATEIKRLAAQGIPRRSLAATYGVALETISRIVRGDTWRDAPEPAAEIVPGEVEASQARFLARLAVEGLAPGLERLQREAATQLRPELLLQEAQQLGCTPPGDVVDSGDGRQSAGPDGGSNESNT